MRVGFVVNLSDRGWIGGLNYMRNLVNAVWDLPGRSIEPVLLDMGSRDPELIATIAPCERIEVPALAWSGPRGLLRRALLRFATWDPILERELERLGIDALSHSGIIRRGSPVASLPWMADFQHIHLPHLFSARELAARDRTLRAYCRAGDRIIVSSETALADLRSQAPGCAARARCLRFVSSPVVAADASAPELARQRYDLPDRFFYLPNQFWVHKNHQVVVAALERLGAARPDITVVATGSGTDPRDPQHQARLMERVAAAGLSTRFRNLGIVPLEDVGSLMRRCVAVINPSRFEGWSTTVEEAKSLGKTVLLSDIPVHREQAPSRAHYFGTDDADALASLLVEVDAGFDPAAEAAAQTAAREALPARRQAFARTFESIVQEAVAVRAA